jgi:hypothetical protein
MMSYLSRALASAFVAICLFVPVARAAAAYWVGGPAGTWSEPTNWSTGVVPNDIATKVTIDDDPLVESVVVLDQFATVGDVLVDAHDGLNIDPNRWLRANAVTIAGSINLATSSQLIVSDSVWIPSEGALSLSEPSSRVACTSAYYLLRNEGRIEGAGTFFRPALNNEAKVVANVPGKPLQIEPYVTTARGLHFNAGELIAENGGHLNISVQSSSFTPLENANGLIEARGDSTVSLQRIRLVGGRVSTSAVGGSNEGAVTVSFSVLENVTLERNVKLDSVMFSDRVVNNTRLEETTANNFYVEGIATISGDGWLELNNGVISAPPGNFPTPLGTLPGLINDVNHTIKGPGTINPATATDRIALENRGVIEADEGALQWNLRSTTQSQSLGVPSINSGTICAKSGGRVEILGSNPNFGDTLTNSTGTTMGLVEAGVDSTIVLGNMTLRGGILRAVAPDEGSTAQAGKVITNGTQAAHLEDIRLEGRIGDTIDNSRFSLGGTIENTGLMAPGFGIHKPTTLTGGGEVHLQTFSGIAGYPQLDFFYDPLVNENNLIRGAGFIGDSLAFINRAVVQADIPNATLSIVEPGDFSSDNPQPFVNSGEFKAINGGKLTIAAEIINFEGSDLGTIHAGSGSEVQIAELSGGILSTEGSGKIVFGATGNSARALVNVHNQGSLIIGTWGTPLFRGKTVNDGMVTQTSATTVNFGGPFAELTGDGVWGTSNIALAFVVGSTSAPSIFTHGSEHTIQGGGSITVTNGAFINRGTVIANGTTPLRVTVAQGATIQQRGTLVVPSSRTMEVQINDELFVNRGTVNATGTFQLKRMNPGTIEFRNAPGAELHVNSIFSVMLPNSNGFAVSLWNQDGALMTGHGKVNLFRTSANHETLFRNSGTLRPAGADDPFGDLFVSGNFQQDATGVLEIELGGPAATGDFDSLQVIDGRAFLGGTLDISLVNAYDPAIGDSFEILTNTGGLVTGIFDEFTAPALSGRWWALNYFSDKVVLSIEQITADFDGNGIVDNLDLDDWQSAYGVDASGDADGDGDSDGRDFLAWQRQFGSGIATEALIVTVPEPSALSLFLACGFALCTCRRPRMSRSVGRSTVSVDKCHSEGTGTDAQRWSATRRISVRRSRGLLALLILSCTCRAAHAAEAVWVGGPAGTWSDPANWSTGIVPNLATTNVTIDDNGAQDSVVVLDQNATIQNLVVNAGDEFNFDPSRVLTTNSAMIGGEVALAATSQLKASDFIWLEPEATLTLVDTAQITRSGTAQYVPIMNQGRIEGAGGFLANDYRYALNNQGMVVANVPGKQLQMKLLGTNVRGVHLNMGELIAENGGELRIAGEANWQNQGFFTPLENSTGVIEARGDSKISMWNVRLIGGQLSTSSVGGSSEGLITFDSVMFENVTLEGNLALNSVTFSDRVVNNTDIVVDTFYVEGYATISGDGSMDLNGGSISVPGPGFGGSYVGTPGFVNDVNHTIKGPGSINTSSGTRLAFDNRGLIECDVPSPPRGFEGLQINLRSTVQSTSGGSSINSGIIRAKSGGRIEILGDELTNYSGAKLGLVEAGVDSTVALGATTLRGGILRAVAADEGSTAQSGKVITRRESLPSATLTATLENLRLEGTIGDTVSNSRWNLAGTIENTGVLVGQIAIAKPTNLMGGGEIRVEEGGGIRRIEPVNSSYKIPLVNENNLIHGAGEIGRDLAFTNRGIVQADVADKSLNVWDVSGNPISYFNSGVFQALDGGRLVIQVAVVNYEGSDLGTIHAGEGSETRVSQVNGGILSTEGNGKVVVAPGGSLTSGPFLTDVHNLGNLVFDSHAYVHGKIVNDGTVTQNESNKVYVSAPFTELTGSGVWGTPGSVLAMEVGMPIGGQFVHGPTHTIQGGGAINVTNGSFINHGTLIANGSAPLTVTLSQGATMSQFGTLNVQGGHDMVVDLRDSRFTNHGIVDVAGAFLMRRMDAGSLESVNAPGGTIALRGSLALDWLEATDSQATLWNQSGATFSGKGAVDFVDGSSPRTGLLRNSGLLRPEGEFAQLGRIYLDGDFQQDATGTLEMNVAGTEPGEFDALILSGSDATLGGSLEIYPLATFDPPVGQMYTLIDTQGGTVTGTFDTFTAPALSGRWWSLEYLTDKVVLSVEPITADFNLDGIVNDGDLDDWQTAYQAGTNLGDADGDGDSDGRDFLLWQRQYGSGVPLASSRAVPEPSGLTLVLAAVALACPLRRVAKV